MDWDYRKQIAHKRMEICKQCPKFNELTTQCRECGCVLIMKTLMLGSKCPLDKWEKEEENQIDK